MEHEQVGAERERRDDEEAQPLEHEVPARVAERPGSVPRVVVRDRDEERADSGRDVVEPDDVEEDGVDREVDEVPGRADDAELDELLPVRAAP